MQLTGKQIVERKIVTNVIEKAIQQQGVDVRIKEIRDLNGYGYVPVEGKTVIPEAAVIKPHRGNWVLSMGYYEIVFEEACDIPADCVLNYKTRSSLVRCGAIVESGQFDGGFKTDNMGAFLNVARPIKIEVGARVAQAIVTESYPVDNDNLYQGQFQNDKQRK